MNDGLEALQRGLRFVWLTQDPTANPKAPDGKQHPHGYKSSLPCPPDAVFRSNYAICLANEHESGDGYAKFICIDVDKPELVADLTTQRGVWTQRTKRGFHQLYLAPPGLKPCKALLHNEQGKHAGEILAQGMITGPGSSINDFTYTYMYGDLLPAPKWVLDALKAGKKERPTPERSVLESVPHGHHDKFITSMAGALRNYGLTRDTIAQGLKALEPLLQDVDQDKPFTASYYTKKAEYAVKNFEQYNPPTDFLPESFVALTDVNTNKEITRWLLYRFVPQHELVLMYGKGGIGKSSWASWLAHHTLRKGLTFGFCGVEEPFLRFGIRTWLSDKSLDIRNLYDIGNSWVFPRDTEKLKEALLIKPIDVLYFDSIYNHFEVLEGLNIAERARACLSSLAKLVQECNVTIVGTFHENKMGDFLGSVEMTNVARVVLHATRGDNDLLRIKVKKTNFISPAYSLTFTGESMQGQSLDGEPWLEENEEGEVIPEMIYVINAYHKSTGEEEEEEEEAEDPRVKQIKELIEQGKSQREISRILEIPRATIYDLLKKDGNILTIRNEDVIIEN